MKTNRKKTDVYEKRGDQFYVERNGVRGMGKTKGRALINMLNQIQRAELLAAQAKVTTYDSEEA